MVKEVIIDNWYQLKHSEGFFIDRRFPTLEHAEFFLIQNFRVEEREPWSVVGYQLHQIINFEK